MQIIEFKGEKYPGFQAFGNAAQFAIPYAHYFCNGKGYDIGCMKEEWSLPGSIPIDMDFDDPYHADNLPAVSYTHLTLPTIAVCRSRWSPYH